MCGIAGVLSLNGAALPRVERALAAMNHLIAHRGPDGQGIWVGPRREIGLAHRRLAIVDLTSAGRQPMLGRAGGGGTSGTPDYAISYNGEIYNYPELRAEFADRWAFRSSSDTECILAAYERLGDQSLQRLRGMFAFALWDERRRRLFCARDRFGIKPFYYAIVSGALYFASEAKALLPCVASIETDPSALAEYLTFQYTIGEHTLFKGIRQLMPGHALVVENGLVRTWRYWDVKYDIDHDHSPSYFQHRLEELMEDTVLVHTRSDVPVGAYVSGGIDSSLVAALAFRAPSSAHKAFHGRFTSDPGYDESRYAELLAKQIGSELFVRDITADDFRARMSDVIYHLDFPVAGPGSFPQFMVSELAAQHLKVVLGGQGGDEIFGGYARYLVAYFEQCIKAAIDGTYRNGHYVVTIESIVPNLGVLREYKPMIKEFWREGLFGSLDERYFRLIDRSTDMVDEVDWSALDKAAVYEQFLAIFNNPNNVRKEAYLDRMTHFDFKCLLPALLHVEDRMSMAHGLESRVPLLDHNLVEFVAQVPADVKFAGGQMKHLIKTTFGKTLPDAIINRRDKMGFPVPLKEWCAGPLANYVRDVFEVQRERNRPYFNTDAIVAHGAHATAFSRKFWGLLSLELWHQRFHDCAEQFRQLPATMPDAAERLSEAAP